MKFSTLISVDGLAQFLNDPNWVIVDCRFWLDNSEKGRLDYQDAHIPGAVYAHLDEDLAGPVLPGETGRHPLPTVDSFVQRLSAWGISSETQVVVYDDRGGMIAARLWWMLRWLGHELVALLDGGYPAWLEEGQPVTDEIISPETQQFIPKINPNILSTSDDILQHFGDPGHLLIDSQHQSGFAASKNRLTRLPDEFLEPSTIFGAQISILKDISN